jgi:hypothetical protein
MFLFYSYNRIYFGPNIDYNTQVKPILNKKCISCHGGVKQSGDFSLITRATALEVNESGVAAIVPGEPEQSEMIRRLHLNDPDERMPQESPPLSTDEIKILTQWIEQGAQWGLHWAYSPLTEEKKQATDLGLFSDKIKLLSSEKLDQFVKEKLNRIGLSPNKPATNAELLRRVSLDIIGLPAPPKLQQLFLTKEIDYASLVDSLLSMEAYGEKWATMWLDIARYADSKGYERDPNRTIWPYRDYVIKSFNNDKPYDQFIIEQMAGDLLENPTDDQYIATGFHRNTSTNDEGGTNNEEYRVKAVIDRVSTTWEGLMGTTMACVQCHGHPYDPFTHEEFYQSFAFLNNTRDADTHMDYPRLKLLDTIQQEKLDSIESWVESISGPDKAKEMVTFAKTVQPVIYSIETDSLKNASFYDTKYLGLRTGGQARIPKVNLDEITTLLLRAQSNEQKGTFFISLDDPTGPIIGKLNVSILDKRYGLLEIPLSKNNGKHDLYLHYENPRIKNKDAPGILFDWFYFTQDFPGKGNKEQLYYKNIYFELLSPQKEHTLIMRENPPKRLRKTHVFDRGNWLVPDIEVAPGVPAVLLKEDISQPQNRLEFAQWIANDNNPLTARTFVNRVWEQLFGSGIVATTEDLGSQGAIPTHQELLDFLSYEWMHHQDWKTKDLIRSIVLSKTYGQSAKASPLSLEKDPYNMFLSRGPRVRLSAEQIRDQALSISGLLSKKIYGPPVMPFQPSGIWQSPYSNEKWSTSEGEDRYRRGVYTMIKRSSIYPSMETFDSPQRLVCTSRRVRTNTPLQALVTLNDPVYVEAAQFLADRMLRFGGNGINDQIDYAYQLAMSRPITNDKKEVLADLYYNTVEELESQQNDCPPDTKHFALTTVANAILNLDELLTK